MTRMYTNIASMLIIILDVSDPHCVSHAITRKKRDAKYVNDIKKSIMFQRSPLHDLKPSAASWVV